MEAKKLELTKKITELEMKVQEARKQKKGCC
jgi:hypothetical protein